MTTYRDEGIAKTGEQVIHLEWAKRYRFAQSNVEPSTNGQSKGIVIGAHSGARRLDQVRVKVRMRSTKEEFGEGLDSVSGKPELWPPHVREEVAISPDLRDYCNCAIRVHNVYVVEHTCSAPVAVQRERFRHIRGIPASIRIIHGYFPFRVLLSERGPPHKQSDSQQHYGSDFHFSLLMVFKLDLKFPQQN